MSAAPDRRERAGIHVTVVLAALSMFGPFTTDLVFPGFQSIGHEFGADTPALQQITSVYLAAFAVMSLLHGALSDALGRRTVMIVGTVLYAAASAGCALSVNLPMLLVFRALQGMCAGSGTIVSRAVVRDMFDGPQAQRLMSHIAMIFGLAPAVAPIIGGGLLALGPWPGLFWALVLYGVLMSAGAASLPETHPREARTPLRLGKLLASLWSVARSPEFLRVTFAGAIGFASQFLYIAGAPIFVVHLLGKGERDFWILFVPLISGLISGAWLVGRLAGRVAPTTVAGAGYAIAIVGGALNVVLSLAGLPQLPWAVVAPTVIAFGMALVFPITQLMQLDLFPTRRGAAASVGMFLSLTVTTLTAAFGWLVSNSITQMATASWALAVAGALLWVWHRLSGRRGESARAQDRDL